MFELQAKKSLGQNFLKNKHIVNQIIEAGDIDPADIIVEIGPGTGALTESIIQKLRLPTTEIKNKGLLIAIEKDSRAIPILQQRFLGDIESGYLHILEQDVLSIDIGDTVHKTVHNKRNPKAQIPKKTYTLIANIPYYITGAIIRQVLEADIKPNTAVLLVQKEVAERIKTEDNILSHSIHVFGKPELICKVGRQNFIPVPGVDSAVIKISNISNDRLEKYHIKAETFFQILKAGFSHKRKKLLSNLLENHNRIDKQSLVEIFNAQNLNQSVRAEELSTEQWLALSSQCAKVI